MAKKKAASGTPKGTPSDTPYSKLPPLPNEESDELDALIANLNAGMAQKGQYSGRIARGRDFINTFATRRPTGSIGLDLGIGGGYPCGGVVQIYGREGAGKTTLANLAIAENQRVRGPDSRVFIAVSETAYDRAYARKCKVSVAYDANELERMEMELGRALTEEERRKLTSEVGKVYIGSGESCEQALDNVVTLVRTGKLDLVVIDSIAAMEPAAMLHTSVAERGFGGGGRANMLGSFLRKLCAVLCCAAFTTPIYTTIICINQVIDKMGTTFSGGLDTPGGHALKHHKLVDIMVKSSVPSDQLGIGEGENKWVYGRTMHWRVMKGKAGCHEGAFGKFDFYLEPFDDLRPGDVDNAKELLELGTEAGILTRSGSWFSYNDTRIGNGYVQSCRNLRDNPELYTMLYDELCKRKAPHETTG